MKKKMKLEQLGHYSFNGEANKIPENQGFDDMAAITLGDSSKIIKHSERNSSASDSKGDVSIYDAVPEKDIKKKNNRLPIILAIILSLTIISCVQIIFGDNSAQDELIQVNHSHNYFEGLNYEEVVSLLKEQGFTNIELKPIGNHIIGWIVEDGEVEEVSINGETMFNEDSSFPPDAKIIVTYHSFPDDITETAGLSDTTTAGVTTSVPMTTAVSTATGADLTLAMDEEGTWYAYESNGLIDWSYTGLVSNEAGTWYVEGGIVNFDKNGTFVDANGTEYMISNGKLAS